MYVNIPLPPAVGPGLCSPAGSDARHTGVETSVALRGGAQSPVRSAVLLVQKEYAQRQGEVEDLIARAKQSAGFPLGPISYVTGAPVIAGGKVYAGGALDFGDRRIL